MQSHQDQVMYGLWFVTSWNFGSIHADAEPLLRIERIESQSCGVVSDFLEDSSGPETTQHNLWSPNSNHPLTQPHVTELYTAVLMEPLFVNSSPYLPERQPMPREKQKQPLSSH